MKVDDLGNPLVTPRAFDLSVLGDNQANLAVTGSSQTLTPGITVPDAGCQAMFTNIGTQTVFLRTDGTVATVNNGHPIMANTQVVFTLKGGAALRAIAATTGSTLYVTLGLGA